MNLHIESHGSGAPLALLHGWGMHGGIWESIVPSLAQHFRVHCVDLPGHGMSALQGNFTLDALAAELSAQFDEPLNVCGWSLGGMVALRWSRLAPQQVRRLVLVTSTPCFTEREDWLFGMTAEMLQQFAAELERDYAATLRRFLALQVRGGASERELLTDLRVRLFSRGEPDVKALRGGLEILRDADLRAELSAIRQPALVIAGEHDKLTPPEASYYLAQTLSDARIVEVAGAAHAPFLSHPELFAEQIVDFLHE